MKLERLPMVMQAATERQRLLDQLDTPEIQLSIDGAVQDSAMIEFLRPMILGEIRARVRRIEDDLTALGVQIPATH